MEQRERPEGEVHAQHEELAVGEVDHAHHAEDEGEPHRDERVDPAQKDGGDDQLGNYVHGRSTRAAPPTCDTPGTVPGAPAGSAKRYGRLLPLIPRAKRYPLGAI